MITDFRVFESANSQITLKKGDLAKYETSNYKYVYLILNDVYSTDERAETFFVGYVDKVAPFCFSFDFNEDVLSAFKKQTTRNWHLEKLKDEERKMIIDEMNKDRNEISYNIKKKLEIVEDFTGVDLKKLPELVDYEIRTSANKYNL